MINLKLIFTLLVGIVFGIAFNSLFAGLTIVPVKQSSVTNIHPKILENQVRESTKKFETQLDSLMQNNIIIHKDLQSSKRLAANTKKQNRQLQIELKELVDSRNNTTDPIEQNKDCDSLQNKIVMLLQNDYTKDSIQELIEMHLEKQIQNKDSTIDLFANQTQQLKLSFDESILNQEILIKQNRIYEKQFKRQKIKRKLRSVVTMVAAGFAGYYLLSH